MEPIKAHFEIIKVEEKVWDIAILAEEAVLQAFAKTYDNLFYIEQSVFEQKPAVIAPDFPNRNHAAAWKAYWEEVFADPENSCKSCPTVGQLLNRIEKGRNET